MKHDPRFDYELEDALADHELEDIFDYELFTGDEVEGADFLIPELTLGEEEFETMQGCTTPCPSPPPPKGQFSAPNEKGHRWFTPEYQQYPSNLWHLAKVVRDRMLADVDFDESKVPTESQIRSAIRSHPCNAHFTKSKPMFMPRFGADRCTGKGRYYGSIYIPLKFDGRAPGDTPTSPQPDTPGPDFILPDAMLDDGASSGEKLISQLEFGRRCRETDRPVVGSDDRKRVTGHVPYRGCASY